MHKVHDGGCDREATGRDPQAVADEAARLFTAGDQSTFRYLGFALVEIAPGRGVLSFTVAKHHLNSAGVCHGGVVFALADSALGVASCSHGIQTLAQHADIHWLRPAHEGDVLTATASEVSKSGRTAVYDIAVANQDGVLVATVRGMTRSTGLPVGAGVKKK
jgi:acyl-CoA thioesterase